MSKLQELINELCPNGVKFYMLRELEENNYIKLGRGNIISKEEIRNTPGDYPVYSSSIVGDGEIGRYGKYMFDDERITWSIDGGGKFFYRNNLKYSVTNVSGWIKVINERIINTKYLYYSLINSWTTQEYNYTKKAHPSVIRNEYSIPVPPMEVQCEIVNTLDEFTHTSANLLASLTAELENRKKQFKFYRNKLFEKVKEKSEILKIQDISKKISSGGTPLTSVSEYYNGEIPWLRTQEVNFNEILDTEIKITDLALKNSSAKMIPANCVIVAMYGATVGKSGINKIPLTTNQACCNIEVDETKVDYKYLFYWLSERYEYIKSLGQGSQTNINSKIVKELEVPVLSLNEQKRVIEILDKYTKTTKEILESIPKEIKLRKQQYEYYRDQLLSFRKVEI